jgi:thioester reductase-like protein
VGDILVKSAVDAGLSACIHRLGYIGPHSKTGACNEKDWLSVLLEGVRELAAMPPCSSAMQVLPVDALCKAFLVLSGKRAAEGIVAYHYTCEGTVPIADVLDCWKERILSAGGRDVDVVSLVAWRRLLAQSSLEQLKSLFSNGIPDRVGRPVALTSAALRHFGAGGDLFQTPAPLQCLIQL